MAGSVYWVGADNNIWLKGPGGVRNMGQALPGNPYSLQDAGFESGLGSYQATRISDPNAPSPSGAPGGGGGGYSTDPSQAIGSINSAINRLSTQQNSGTSSIDASYQDALSQLLGARNQGEQAYGQSKQTNATNYVGAKNTIGSQAGQALNGLMRLLGSRGAGGSSAAKIAAPQAVTRNATIQRGDVGNTFAQNQQGLDQNWGQYLQGYNNQVTSAGAQRDRAKTDLQTQIDNNRANLLQSLAQLQSNPADAQPYIDQANALYDKTANVSVAPINYQTQAYQAPSLSSYTYNPQQTAQYNQQSGSDYFSPYLSTLLGKKQLQGI